MKVKLVREFRFEAAHRLPNVPAGHRCENLHGHSYKFEISISGTVDPHTGWLLDYGVIDAVVEPLRSRLDHRTLNDVEGLENPTSELLARWLWDHIKPGLPALGSIKVWEMLGAYCVYKGEP